MNLVATEDDTVQIERTTPDDVAKRAALAIVDELPDLVDTSLAINASEPDHWPCVQTILDRSARVYRAALADTDTFLVSVPHDASYADVTSEVREAVLSPSNRH